MVHNCILQAKFAKEKSKENIKRRKLLKVAQTQSYKSEKIKRNNRFVSQKLVIAEIVIQIETDFNIKM